MEPSWPQYRGTTDANSIKHWLSVNVGQWQHMVVTLRYTDNAINVVYRWTMMKVEAKLGQFSLRLNNN